MAVKALQNELDVIELSRGDVIIEMATSNVGVLLKKDRRIDIYEDDIYFWKIKWNNPNDIVDCPTCDFFEEEHLKLSNMLYTHIDKNELLDIDTEEDLEIVKGIYEKL